MKKPRKLMLFIACAALVSLLFFFFWAQREWQSKPVPLLPLVREDEVPSGGLDPAAKPSLKGVEIALVDHTQRLNWKLRVDLVVEENGICLLSGIKGEYYTLQGEKYLVEAAAGEMGKDFSWLRLSPEVVLSGKEIRLRADELSWTEQAGEEITGRGLRVERESMTVNAEKFTFNPEKGDITLPGESRWSFR
ncbi:MAG TPA: hypothetical protein VIL83_02720 [Capillibacterium sp.]